MMWDQLSKRAKKTSTGFNLFATLHERAKLENERPNAIDFAKMSRVVEDGVFAKTPRIEVKRNLLNVTYYVLHNPRTNEYFRLDKRERFLWEKMDGDHTIRDLALEYFNHYGAFAYDKIVELVFDLKKQTFLEEEYVHIFQDLSYLAKSKRWLGQLIGQAKKFLYWEFPLKNVDGLFGILYSRLFKIFFVKPVVWVLGVISLGGIFAFGWVGQRTNFSILHHDNSLALGIVLLFLLNLMSLFLHEMAHGVATKHFGRKVHKAGLLVYFGWPAFYVDTTDMWMESKWKRIVVSVVGPWAEVIVAGVISILLLIFPGIFGQALLFKFAMVSYVSVFVNMNPLVEWDGYFIFMDLLGIPCLRKRSLYFIQQTLWKKLGREKFTKKEWLYTVFGGLSAVWSVVAVVLGLQFWQKHVIKLWR